MIAAAMWAGREKLRQTLRWLAVCIGLGMLGMLAAMPAYAAKRALVVGNANYTHIGTLPRSEADAQDLARVLRSLGFVVHSGQALLNRNAAALNKDVEDFQKTIQPGDEVVFYFSGHGVTHEVLGNLLVPTDAPALNRLAPPGRVLQQYLGVNDALKAMADMKPRVLVSILDACRSFPTVKPNGKSDSPSVGLQTTPPVAASGVEQLVMYAAAHGQEALAFLNNGQDKTRNSVFTRVLLEEMVRPSPSVNQLAHNVARRVYALTKNEKDGAQNVEYRAIATDTQPFSFVPVAVQAAPLPDTSAKDAEIAQLKKQLAEREKAAAEPVITATPSDAPWPIVTAVPSTSTRADTIFTSPPALLYGRYQVLGDGSEVKDLQTGLIWARCSVGQTWSGSRCAGQVKTFTFYEAPWSVGNGWRVPTVRELQSLIWCSTPLNSWLFVDLEDGLEPVSGLCDGMFVTPAIRAQVFPLTDKHWTATRGVVRANLAWVVDFRYGHVVPIRPDEKHAVLMVRANR